MSQYEPSQEERSAPAKSSNRGYIIAAVVLVVVIVVLIIVIVTQGIPALRGAGERDTVTEVAGISAPTSTRAPTEDPESASATPDISPAALAMQDTATPLYDFSGAGARPAVEWTGFFGEVADAAGTPVAGVTVIVWDEFGQPAADPIQTDEDGAYEIRLADEPRAGLWSIQLLDADNQPTSHHFAFRTDEDTQAGIQQIQVLWKEIP